MNQICNKSVHDWKIPKDGDIGLTCDRCRDFADFSTIEEERQMSILDGRKKYYGILMSRAFEAAFLDAFHADQKSGRWDTIAHTEDEEERPIDPLTQTPC